MPLSTTLKPLSIPPKTLYQSILSTGMSFILADIKSWDGTTNLAAGDFGTQAFGAFINADRTVIEFFEFDPSTIASSSITILNRGLPFSGSTTPVTAYKLDWTANESTVLLGSDTPQFLLALMTYIDSGTKTLTNTRITKRVVGTTSTATPTINADTTDVYNLTALATNTAFQATTGTPTDAQPLIVRIKSDGSIRTITWNAVFVARGVALPTATVANKYLIVGFLYNIVTATWDCVCSVQES